MVSTSLNQKTDSLTFKPISNNQNLWEAKFKFRGSMTPTYNEDEKWDMDFWLESDFDINVTKNWAISYRVRFDILNNDILYI